MTARKSVSVSLSPELHQVAERLLASGRYGNFSEVVRAGLRLLDERESGFHAFQAARRAERRQEDRRADAGRVRA